MKFRVPKLQLGPYSRKPTRLSPWVGLDVRFSTSCSYRLDSLIRSPAGAQGQQQPQQHMSIELDEVRFTSVKCLPRGSCCVPAAVHPRYGGRSGKSNRRVRGHNLCPTDRLHPPFRSSVVVSLRARRLCTNTFLLYPQLCHFDRSAQRAVEKPLYFVRADENASGEGRLFCAKPGTASAVP